MTAEMPVGSPPPQAPGAAGRFSTIPVEARPYQGMSAGIVTRAVANIIDVIVVVLILALGFVGWICVRFLRNPAAFTVPSVKPFVAVLIVGLWVQGVYFALAWMTTGRTLGDYVMGVRVVNFRGNRMHPAGAIVRAATCVVFPAGLLWVAVSRRNRSVQDLVLRTSVRYDWALEHRGPADPHATLA